MQPFLEPAERLMLIRDGLYNQDPAVRRRTSLVLELDRGSNFMQVARSAKCHRKTVKYWYLRYLERRTPAALRSVNDPGRQYEDRVNHGSRARALVALAESRAGRRLPWSAEEREQVIRDSRSASDPTVRFRQAIRFALDRGVPVALIARASSNWRAVINDLLFLELHGVSRRQFRKATLRGDVANDPHAPGCLVGQGGAGIE
jgi:hypothetical protein